MTDIAKHIRIFELEPDDDFVIKRTAAIKASATAYKAKKTVDSIIGLANSLAAGLPDNTKLDPEIAEIVEKAIKKESVSFVADGQQLQLISCGLVAALVYMEESTAALIKSKITLSEVFYLAIWSALSFKEPLTQTQKLEQLRLEISEMAKDLALKVGNVARDRQNVSVWKEIAAPADGNAITYGTSIQKVMSATMNSLIMNSVLDREEINILWWMINDWSSYLSQSISSMNDASKVVITALELSSLLTRIPADAHIEMSLRNVDRTKKYTGKELLSELNFEKVVSQLPNSQRIGQNQACFPLLLAFQSKAFLPESENLSFTLEEWCRRAFVESSLLRLGETINVTI